MASGKTTFGKALAGSLNRKFIDLDAYIEKRAGLSVTQIFKEYGQDGFRIMEKEALHTLDSKDNLVVACGGGTPCFFDNMEYMNHSGVTVFLQVSVSVLLNRLVAENSLRPLVAGKSAEELAAYIGNQLEERLPFYQTASILWDGESLEKETEISDNVSRFISSFPEAIKN